MGTAPAFARYSIRPEFLLRFDAGAMVVQDDLAEVRTEARTANRDDLPETLWSRRIENGIKRLGAASAWIWLLILAVIVANVLSRYVFGQGRIEFEEVQWHLYSVGFLIALSYCLSTDSHVRVDVLHERLSPRTRAWIELYGLLLLYFPFVALVIIFSVPFITYSFATGEVSQAPGGLPYRWLLKSMLLVSFILLAIAGVARLLRVWQALFGTSATSPVRKP